MNIRKRILSALMSVAMLATLISTTAFASSEPTITVSSPTATVGTSVDVTVSLSNNPGIVSMLLNIGYDKDVLTLTKVTDVGVLGAQSHSNDYSLNPYILYWSNGTATSNYTSNGTVATLSFAVAAYATAGDYPITVSYDKDNDGIFNVDFAGVEFATVNGKVTVQEKPKQNITGVTLSDKTFTYDGTEKSITVAGTLPTGANVAYTNNKATDADTYNTTAVVTADGYNDLTLNAKMVISPKALTVTGLAASNKSYDGTKDAVISGGTLSGKVSGDDVTVTMPTKGTFANANAGSNVAVSIDDIALTGTKTKNYKLTQPSGLKANITAAPITVTADSFTIVKSAAIPTLTYKITNGKLFGSDTLSGSLASNAVSSKVGTYDITQGALKASSNYNLLFVKGTIAIVDKTPQNITVSDITAKTYGDGSFKVTVIPDAVSKLNTFTYTSSDPNVAEITSDGTVTIKATGVANITIKETGNEEYAPFEKTQQLVVNKKALSIKVDNITATYGDKINANVSYDGFVSGENKTELTTPVKVNGLSAQPNVGEYDITLSDAQAANYEISYVNAKLVVNKKDITVTNMKVFDKKADDSKAAVINTSATQFEGLVSGDDVDVDTTNAKAEFASAETGENIAVAITHLALCGKTAGNYNLTNKTFDTTANIKAEIKAADIATQLLAPKLSKNSLTFTLPSVPEGFTLKLKSSDNTDIISTNGNIAPVDADTVVNVVFEVVNANDETDVADTVTLAVTVPKSDKINVAVTAEENGTATGSGAYIVNTDVTVVAAPSSDYTFNGWYENDTLVSSNSTYTFKAIKDINLVAKFTVKRSGGGVGSSSSSYFLTFNSNGGSKVTAVKVKKNEVASEPATPTKVGFVFDGWYTDSKLTTKYNFTAKTTKSVTLYAKWSEKPIDNSKNELVLTIGKKDAKVFGETKANDVAPIIRNDRTMLPARFIAESLGATVIWTETEPNKVIIRKDDIEIIITIDSDKALVNGKEITLDCPAFIENDRTYTPIRFISEELGAKVTWSEENQTVTITK